MVREAGRGLFSEPPAQGQTNSCRVTNSEEKSVGWGWAADVVSPLSEREGLLPMPCFHRDPMKAVEERARGKASRKSKAPQREAAGGRAGALNGKGVEDEQREVGSPRPGPALLA